MAENRIFTLNEPNAPRLNPALACEVGLNESLILLQLEFWISISNNFIEGRKWTYQSSNDIKDKSFPFWSKATINRAIKNLIDAGYVIEGNYNKKKFDKTRWFALNYEKLAELKSITVMGVDSSMAQNDSRLAQNEPRTNQNEPCSAQNETTIPEITTENTTETSTDKKEGEDHDSENHDELSKVNVKVVALTDYLIRLILQNNKRANVPKKGTPRYMNWVSEIDKLSRIGPIGGDESKGYNVKEIYKLIEFTQKDSFWKNNILSAKKLREKVIMLENQMKSKGDFHGSNREPTNEKAAKHKVNKSFFYNGG